MLTYINKKNNRVQVKVTCHSIKQLQIRYCNMFKKQLNFDQAKKHIAKIWPGMDRVISLTQKQIKRNRKYTGETLLFRDLNFTFIINNSVLRTIEISQNGKCHLNQKNEKPENYS